MYKFIHYFLILIILTSCANPQNKKLVTKTIIIKEIQKPQVIDTLNCGLNFNIKNTYIDVKSKIKSLKLVLKKRYTTKITPLEKNQFLDSISPIFDSVLLNEIIPYWYGTTWDFNGHTSKPNYGNIACGYFVSTTLKDMGLNLNRYKLAQQNPQNEALSIAISKKHFFTFHESRYNDNDYIHKEINKMKDGLYFIGLDNHVGYLYLHNHKSYFIHSNYIDGYVMVELTQNSLAFESAKYHISNISNNKDFLYKWLFSKDLKIHL